MKKLQAIGQAQIGGKIKPIYQERTITKGQKKGMLEVLILAKYHKYKKVIINPLQIHSRVPV